MNLKEKLQKLASTSQALRVGHLKQAGFGTALLGLGKSIANKGAKHVAGQVAEHGALGAALGVGGGAMMAAAAPGHAVNTYKANKVGFNPAVHKANLGLE